MNTQPDYRVKIYDRDGTLLSDQSYAEFCSTLGQPFRTPRPWDPGPPGNIFIQLLALAEEPLNVQEISEPHKFLPLIVHANRYSGPPPTGWVPFDPDS